MSEKSWVEMIVDLASVGLNKISNVSCHDIHAELKTIDDVIGISELDYSNAYGILLTNFGV